MVELKNWHISKTIKSFVANGIVYGHSSPKCCDGTDIHTSIIISAKMDEAGIILQTRNNEYILKKECIDFCCPTDILNDFVKEYFKDNADFVQAELQKWIDERKAKLMEKGGLLSSNTLYLELAADIYNCFNSGLFMNESGELLIEQAYDHIGMFKDSTILSHSNVRWFTNSDGVEFYNTLYDSERKAFGYIRNVGSEPLAVSFTWGETVTIQPDELYEAKSKQ